MAVDRRYAKNVVSVISAAAVGDVAWDDMLSSVAHSIQAERLTLTAVGRRGEVSQDSWPPDPEAMLEYARDYASRDLRIERLMTERLRGTFTTLDVMSPSEVVRCPVHQEFYARRPELWNMATHVMWSEGAVIMPLAHRSAKHGSFDTEEKRLLTRLAPEIARADATRKLTRQHQTPVRDSVLDALDGLSDAIVILDRSGVAIHLNAAAEALCLEGSAFALASGTITCRDPLSREGLSTLVGETLRDILNGVVRTLPPIVVRASADARRYKVAAFASPADQIDRSIIIQISRLVPSGAPTADDIVRATELSPAEARLCVAMIEGVPLRRYAEMNGVSEHTVRTQMKNVRAKLQVRSQAAALVAIMSALR